MRKGAPMRSLTGFSCCTTNGWACAQGSFGIPVNCQETLILPLQPAISERAVRQLFSDVHRRKLADTCQLMLTAIGWLPNTNNCAAAGVDKRYMRPEYVQGGFAIMCGLRLFLLS